MIRKIAIAVTVLLIFGIVLWFANINPGTIRIDLAFGVIEPSIPVAFVATFAIGWIFGLACTGVYIARGINERRRLRKALRIAESEVSSLRSLPIADAD